MQLGRPGRVRRRLADDRSDPGEGDARGNEQGGVGEHARAHVAAREEPAGGEIPGEREPQEHGGARMHEEDLRAERGERE